MSGLCSVYGDEKKTKDSMCTVQSARHQREKPHFLLLFKKFKNGGAKSRGTGQRNELCRFDVVRSAAWVVPGVVEVVAILGSVRWGFCCSSAIWAIVDRIVAAVDDLGLTQPRAAINTEQDFVLNSNIDIAPAI